MSYFTKNNQINQLKGLLLSSGKVYYIDPEQEYKKAVLNVGSHKLIQELIKARGTIQKRNNTEKYKLYYGRGHEGTQRTNMGIKCIVYKNL